MSDISKIIEFLREYKTWVDNGAPVDNEHFSRRWGLCNNLLSFTKNKAIKPLCDTFSDSVLPPVRYPFNNGDSFGEEFVNQTTHLNEHRYKWVNDTLADYDRYGEEQFVLRKVWQRHEHTRVALNKAVRSIYTVGAPVQVLWGKRGWIDASVSWVPYENGPQVAHIYVTIPGHKTVKRWDMSAGMFHNIRKTT